MVKISDLKKQLILKFEELKEIDKPTKRDLEEEQIQKEFIWALIEENRVEIGNIRNRIVQKETALENPREKLNYLHQLNAKLHNQLNQQVDVAEHERGQYVKEERELTEIRNETEKLKEEENNRRAEIKGYIYTMKNIQGEIRIMKEQIDKINSNKEKVKLAEEIQSKLLSLEDRRTKINEEIVKMGTERDNIESQQDCNRKEPQKIESDRKCYQSKVEHLECELVDMEGMGNQKLTVFDRLAPKMAEEIRLADIKQQFGVRPLGPVGSHIKLT